MEEKIYPQKLKNSGSSRSIRSLMHLNRSQELNNINQYGVDSVSVISDKSSSYFAEGTPNIKHNSSLSEFKRNLHKLYPCSASKGEYGNQLSANDIQLNLMRRKGHKNLQPKQSQANSSFQNRNIIVEQSYQQIEENNEELKQPYNDKNSFMKHIMNSDKISKTDQKPNTETNKKRNMMMEKIGKKLRFADPEKIVNKIYGNINKQISLNREINNKSQAFLSLKQLKKDKSVDKLKKMNNIMKDRYNRNSKVKVNESNTQHINIDEDQMLHFPEFKVSKNSQDINEISKNSKSAAYNAKNNEVPPSNNGESLYYKYKESLKKQLGQDLERFKVSQSVDYGKGKIKKI